MSSPVLVSQILADVRPIYTTLEPLELNAASKTTCSGPGPWSYPMHSPVYTSHVLNAISSLKEMIFDSSS